MAGYPSLAAAETDGHTIANKDNVPVMVHDGLGAMVETIQPNTPPAPPITSNVTIALTPDQVTAVIAQSGQITITGSMTLADLVKALTAAAQQKHHK